MHARYWKIIHAKTRIIASRRIPPWPTYSLHPDSGDMLEAILHLASYDTGLATGAPVQVYDHAVSNSQFLCLLGLLYLYRYVVQSSIWLVDDLLRRIDIGVSQVLMAALEVVLRPPPLIGVDRAGPYPLMDPGF